MLLADADLQRNAAPAAGGGPERPAIPGRWNAAKRVPEVLRAAKKNGVKLAIVDTRLSIKADTAEIARLSDMLLVLTGPGILDLRAIAPTTEAMRVLAVFPPPWWRHSKVLPSSSAIAAHRSESPDRHGSMTASALSAPELTIR